MKFENLFITGGAGYVGSLLVPQLLQLGYKVTVFDPMYFGNDFFDHNNSDLSLIEGDIRDIQHLSKSLKGHDAVISLGCISNDASFELNEKLSTSVNLDAFEPMVKAAKDAGIKRFIYASSSSVYGVSDQPEVKEDHPLVPVSLYNKYKGMCEPLLFKHQSKNFVCVTIRPATLCGYAPRQRMDLSVNILTNHAINKNKITVFGGKQLRPNLHIQDMCDLYKLLLIIDDNKIAGETFNAGYENQSIMDIAKIVKKTVEQKYPDMSKITIEKTSSDDIRSYHINSDKIKDKIGFVPRFTIQDAVKDLCVAMISNKIPNSFTEDIYFNVRQIKKLKVK